MKLKQNYKLFVKYQNNDRLPWFILPAPVVTDVNMLH